MDYTIEKLRQGMSLAHLSTWQQVYIETRWNDVKDRTIAMVEKIMADWPVFPNGTSHLNVPDDGLADELRNTQLICAYCFLVQPSYERYNALNIPLEIWLENMPDLTYHMHEENGTLWMDTLNGEFGWHLSILNGRNLKMGRLQFYAMESPEDYPEINVKKGDHLVGFHIPACGPMSPELCLDAFKRASDYYDTPEHRWDFSHFYCRSWLFNPIYQKYLPPESNIVRMQKLGVILPYPNESRDALRRVFSFGHEDVNTPNPRTTLQRVVQTILKNNEDISAGAIAFKR